MDFGSGIAATMVWMINAVLANRYRFLGTYVIESHTNLRVPFMEIVLITLENAGSCAGAIAGKPRTMYPGSVRLQTLEIGTPCFLASSLCAFIIQIHPQFIKCYSCL